MSSVLLMAFVALGMQTMHRQFFYPYQPFFADSLCNMTLPCAFYSVFGISFNCFFSSISSECSLSTSDLTGEIILFLKQSWAIKESASFMLHYNILHSLCVVSEPKFPTGVKLQLCWENCTTISNKTPERVLLQQCTVTDYFSVFKAIC